MHASSKGCVTNCASSPKRTEDRQEQETENKAARFPGPIHGFFAVGIRVRDRLFPRALAMPAGSMAPSVRAT